VKLPSFLRRRPVPEPWPDSPSSIEAASWRWPRVGGKVACPACGMTGYPGGTWTHAHLSHSRCPDCGGTFSTRGLSSHRAQTARWARVRAERDAEAEVRRWLS